MATSPVADSAGSVSVSAQCSYDLDVSLRLVSVDAAWRDFAVANGAPELVPPRIIGVSVLSAISDPTTALVYRHLFDRVQACREPVVFPIRCDSPEMRRYLELELSPRPAGFRVRSTVVRTEPRPAQGLLEP